MHIAQKILNQEKTETNNGSKHCSDQQIERGLRELRTWWQTETNPYSYEINVYSTSDESTFGNISHQRSPEQRKPAAVRRSKLGIAERKLRLLARQGDQARDATGKRSVSSGQVEERNGRQWWKKCVLISELLGP